MLERERLIARIRQIRRNTERANRPADGGPAIPEQNVIEALEARIDHLENLLEALQDSVHREATRQGQRMADLEARLDPEELSRALAKDARQRGL